MKLITDTYNRQLQLLPKPLDQSAIHSLWLFVLQPMARLREVCQLRRIAVANARLGHLRQQKLIALAPEYVHRHMHLQVSYRRPVPIERDTS